MEEPNEISPLSKSSARKTVLPNNTTGLAMVMPCTPVCTVLVLEPLPTLIAFISKSDNWPLVVRPFARVNEPPVPPAANPFPSNTTKASASNKLLVVCETITASAKLMLVPAPPTNSK